MNQNVKIEWLLSMTLPSSPKMQKGDEKNENEGYAPKSLNP